MTAAAAATCRALVDQHARTVPCCSPVWANDFDTNTSNVLCIPLPEGAFPPHFSPFSFFLLRHSPANVRACPLLVVLRQSAPALAAMVP